MLQYLLNATSIWLLSLVLFDLLLRKENFHTYNRVYLLSTLLTGIFLPLWKWPTTSTIYQTPLRATMDRATIIRENIAHTSVTAHASFDWAYCLWFIYIAGALTCIALLIMEVIQLVRLYRSGRKSTEGNWTIVETGGEHSPFSIFRYLFVHSRALYSREEWDIICIHEEQHGNRMHFIDVLLMQLSRVVFWFHPLVYIYNKRLLLIHEYQADAVARVQPSAYGQFLIEQAMLQPAPSLSHSFNRSPIKKRIIMLTHRTSSYKHLAKLLVLPLLATFLVCCTKSMYNPTEKPVKNGDYATYKGSTFDLSKTTYDTLFVKDAVSGKEMVKISMEGRIPIKMNGKPIYTLNEVDSKPAINEGYKNIRDFMLKNMKAELGQLADGMYKMHMTNVVVDENGQLAYFEYAGIIRGRTAEEMGLNTAGISDNAPAFKMGQTMTLRKTPNSEAEIDAQMQKSLEEKAFNVLQSGPSFTPATKDGKNVPCIIQTVYFMNYFKVQHHQILEFNVAQGEFAPI